MKVPASCRASIGSAPRQPEPPVEDENLDGRPVDNFIDLEITLPFVEWLLQLGHYQGTLVVWLA